MTVWSNWSGMESATPGRVLEPTDTQAVVGAVQEARAGGHTVKMVGSGHSFTSISAPEHTMLRPGGMKGIVAVDRDALTVTARAGTQLKVLNAEAERLGLSLHNMGDIAEQTLAGATSTGTHGSGGVAAGLAAQLAGLELVTGTGEVLRADAEQHPDVFEMARVGLGALGVLTELTLRVEPLFLLQAEERPMSWTELVSSHDDLAREHHHTDVLWFPHTDRALFKGNTRLAEPVAEREPLPAWRAWLDDEFLANTVFGAMVAAGNRVPAAVPTISSVAARTLSPRRYSDVAHRVFISTRTVVFREMEYAVPREAGLAALAEVRRVIDASDWRISFPIEIRTAPADDIPLSTAYDRDSMYLAFHVPKAVDHTEYFTAMEDVMRAHDGRPHWGKVHTLGAADLAELYPRFGDFLAMRDRLDPDRVFANDYLRRVLGE